jgi:hypothetical protein
MGWNHRVIAHDEHKEVYFQIHEVYYDKEGTPDGYTKEGVSVGADSIKGLRWTLRKMRKTLKSKVLSKTNFPKEYKK